MWPSNALVNCDQGIFKPWREKVPSVKISLKVQWWKLCWFSPSSWLSHSAPLPSATLLCPQSVLRGTSGSLPYLLLPILFPTSYLLSCDMGTYADCWMGDFCMPEGSECPPSCNIPAPSECQDGEVMCDMGADAGGCWMGDYCMAEVWPEYWLFLLKILISQFNLRDPSAPPCATLLFPLSVPPLTSREKKNNLLTSSGDRAFGRIPPTTTKIQ